MTAKKHSLFCISSLVIALVALAAITGCMPKQAFPGPETLSDQERAPIIQEFILGVGDKIDIQVYRNEDLKRSIQIDASGKFSFPLIGDVQAAGTSVFALRDKIRTSLAKFIVDPDVTISVSSPQSQKVIVLGEVRNPGYFQLESSITALEAISRAGGFTSDGKKSNVLLMRAGASKPVIISLNVARTLENGDMSQNVILQRGDVLYVPRTFIADVDSFFKHMSTILQPIVLLETGIFLDKQIEHSTSKSVSIAP